MDVVAGRVWVDERRPIRHLDPTLLMVTAALVVIGMFAIYSATSQTLRADGFDPFSRVNKQAVTAVLGFVLLLVMATFDYRFLKVYAGFIYGATVPTVPDLVRVIGVAALTMMLVFLNVEIGTTIVLAAITVGVLVVAGTQAKHLIALAAAAIVLIVLAFQLNVVEEYQVERLLTVFDSGSVSEDARYNLEQSVIAVGSGGMFGRGFLQGSQTNLDYVPEQHTDFIFTVVGEEFGFVGSAFVLALFALLLWRAIRIAYMSKDAFGTFLATGVASMFAIQIFVNVGMVIGIMPITGIPLPFLSYGGTAMLVNFVAIGILLNVHMRRFK
jgi:rod shape determining protein RodA